MKVSALYLTNSRKVVTHCHFSPQGSQSRFQDRLHNDHQLWNAETVGCGGWNPHSKPVERMTCPLVAEPHGCCEASHESGSGADKAKRFRHESENQDIF